MFILPLQVFIPPQLLVVFDLLLPSPDLVLLPVLPALGCVVLVSVPAGGQLGVRGSVGGGCRGGVQGGGVAGGGLWARVLALVRSLVVGEQTGSCTCAAGLKCSVTCVCVLCTVGDKCRNVRLQQCHDNTLSVFSPDDTGGRAAPLCGVGVAREGILSSGGGGGMGGDREAVTAGCRDEGPAAGPGGGEDRWGRSRGGVEVTGGGGQAGAGGRTTVASAVSRGELTTPGSLWRLPLGGWSAMASHPRLQDEAVSVAWLELGRDNRGDTICCASSSGSHGSR